MMEKHLQMEILDKFLPYRTWDEVYQTFMGNNFPWYYYPFVTDSNEDEEVDKFQFVHIISDLNKGYISSTAENVVKIFNDRLNAYTILRIKANLTTYQNTPYVPPFHTDLVGPLKDISKTAIYYMNDTNGGTELEDGTFIEGKGNRLVILPGNVRHRGVGQTDNSARCVINFNYVEK